MVLDGSLGEHICLTDQLTLVVQNFQRTQQRIGGILSECKPVSGAAQQTIFLGELVIELVEIGLLRLDFAVLRSMQLQINELPGTVPDGDHALDALGGHFAQLYLVHAGVLAEVQFSMGQGKAEIAYSGVSGDGFDLLAVLLLRRGHFQQLPVRRGNVLDSLGKLLGEVRSLNGQAGRLRLVAVHILPERHFAQHHLRVVQEIAVQGYAIRRQAALHPLRQLLRSAVTLLEKENIRGDFGASVGLESVVRQANRPQQVGLLRQSLPDLAVFLVQGALGGDKGHNAAGTHLVQRLGDEVVVNE